MQPRREPKLVVSSTHISPDAAGIHMSILVLQVPVAAKQRRPRDVHRGA